MRALSIPLILALVTSIGLAYAQYHHLFNGIFYRCEGFGCMGAGILDVLIFFVGSLIVAIVSAIISRQKRISIFLTTLGISVLLNIVTIGILGYLHRADVRQNVCDAIESCQSDSRLCTWELDDATRQTYPECFKSE